jgi:hypothetical protein
MEVHKQSVTNVNEAVASSVISMNNLILKSQQLNEDMKPVEQLATEVYPKMQIS